MNVTLCQVRYSTSCIFEIVVRFRKDEENIFIFENAEKVERNLANYY